MNKLKLIYGNHWNFGIVVADTLSMYKCAALELGIQASIEKELCLDGHNLLLENFDDDYVKKLEEFHSQGGTFSIIATELLTDDSFNQIDIAKNDSSQYGKTVYWNKRFNNFLKVAKHAKFIFHLNPQQARNYSQLLNRKVTFLPHGYTENFRSVIHRSPETKDIDVLFTGSITPYRKSIIDRLKKYCRVVTSDVLTASFHRDDLVARSKICLNIRQNNEWSVFSNSRGNYHLSNNSFLLTESCSDSCAVIDFISACKGDIVKDTLDILKDGSWELKSQHSFERYKEEMRLVDIGKDIFLSLAC